MIRYFVTCSKGLEAVLAKELASENIGAQCIEPGASGVYFQGNWDVGYKANLWSRIGIRVLAEWGRSSVGDSDSLYEWALTVPWTELMSLDQTFSIEARVRDSQITHSKYAAMRVKDALCDTFRAASGKRPNVDVGNADLPLFLYIYKNEAILYRDMSGQTLHKRGYRDALHKSSLNECVASGILGMAEWSGKENLVDPMCGAGTFVIEAARAGLQRAPGLLRTKFPFQSWPDFEKVVWKDCKGLAHSKAKFELQCRIMANDVHPGALSLAKKDAGSAGVDGFIEFNQSDVCDYDPPHGVSLVTVNPPWGERLDEVDLEDSWTKLGKFLKEKCSGAEAWVLTGNRKALRWLDVKSKGKHEIQYGKIACTTVRYPIR